MQAGDRVVYCGTTSRYGMRIGIRGVVRKLCTGNIVDVMPYLSQEDMDYWFSSGWQAGLAIWKCHHDAWEVIAP